MGKELTEKQRRVIEAIREWIATQGYPPTIRELGKTLGIKSLRGVTTHLDAIAKKGYLSRQRGARGIKLLLEFAANTVEDAIRVPIVGRIAAGQPLLAEENLDGQLVLDALILGRLSPTSPTRHFALKVQGRSMEGAGIMSGDYVVVRQQPNAENGEVVAALLGEEATVKRFYKEENRIRLQPENATMQPIMIGRDQPFEILGKVVAVFRQMS